MLGLALVLAPPHPPMDGRQHKDELETTVSDFIEYLDLLVFRCLLTLELHLKQKLIDTMTASSVRIVNEENGTNEGKSHMTSRPQPN